MGWQIPRTSSSATALRTTSGPIPAGSPMVIPMRGLGRRAKPAGVGLFIDRIVVGFTFGRYALSVTGSIPVKVTIQLHEARRRRHAGFGPPPAQLEACARRLCRYT